MESTYDLLEEELVTRGEAARILGCHPETVTTYMDRGDDNGVKLEYEQVGNLRKTSRQALRRFVDACRAAREGGQPSPTPAARRRQAEADERYLRGKGLGRKVSG